MLRQVSQRLFNHVLKRFWLQGKLSTAFAEEMAGREENVRGARPVAEKLRKEREVVAKLVEELKAARVEAGISLGDLKKRTGIRKSALSRLENAVA